MPLRKISLLYVYRLARRDRRFFNALLKNPRKAIASKKLALSPGDLRRLTRAIKKVYRISGKDLAKILVRGTSSVRPWPTLKPWPIAIRPWP